MIVLAGDFDRALDLDGELVGVEVLEDADETVNSLRSVQPC